jgi:hypothetical protein
MKHNKLTMLISIFFFGSHKIVSVSRNIHLYFRGLVEKRSYGDNNY